MRKHDWAVQSLRNPHPKDMALCGRSGWQEGGWLPGPTRSFIYIFSLSLSSCDDGEDEEFEIMKGSRGPWEAWERESHAKKNKLPISFCRFLFCPGRLRGSLRPFLWIFPSHQVHPHPVSRPFLSSVRFLFILFFSSLFFNSCHIRALHPRTYST